jgi:hypothetical protein
MFDCPRYKNANNTKESKTLPHQGVAECTRELHLTAKPKEWSYVQRL